MLRKNLLILLIASLLIGFIVLSIQAILNPANWPGPLTTHTFAQKDASRLELLWVQTVFTPAYNSRQLAASNGKVFFIGSQSQKGTSGLVALDSQRGNKLLQIREATTVDVSLEAFYVDYRDSVGAYTLTGEKLWQTTLWARNIDHFDVVDGKMYVEAGGGFHLLDAVTGELLATSSLPDIFEGNFAAGIFLSIADTPAFMEHRIFTREVSQEVGMDYSAAVALDRETGNILWRSADIAISNVVATKSLAFVITYKDELQILDARTGQLQEMIQIEPSINFFDRETQLYRRVYQLAIDQTTQTLYILLGDSNQLFAFRIHE